MKLAKKPGLRTPCDMKNQSKKKKQVWVGDHAYLVVNISVAVVRNLPKSLSFKVNLWTR